jgi:CheY-like chemotaxis protein
VNKTLLLVEDSEDDAVIFTRALKTSGVSASLKIVADGREAVDYLLRAMKGSNPDDPLPDLVLLDLKLPQVLALDVLKWIRSQPALQTLIIIVLTSSRHESDLDQAYRLGANSYLVKPSTLDELVKMVRSLGDYWFAHNQTPMLRT